jgi:serine/threonine-protein kinase
MDVKLEARALELLEQALDWPPADVAARLRARCGEDSILFERVTKLLTDTTRAGRALPTQLPTALHAEPLAPPEQIGPYQLVEVVGVGGMGTVYRAERVDGLFQQTVAIKLVRPSLLSDELVQRFAAERRILARLHHRNIAQILDGGTAATGHAYFIMEYVQGESITEHAVRTNAALATRLRLFESVCRAVQYAHSRFVVHAVT